MRSSYPIVLLMSMVKPGLGLDASIMTGFAGTNHANGNVFTIKAKTTSISITSFDVNMDDTSDNIGPMSPAPMEVYFMPGIDPGYEVTPSPYQMIFSGSIAGQGKGQVTSLPDFDNPVVIPAGATYSFYVTVVGLYLGTSLWYNIGQQVGSVVAQDQYMEVHEGYAVAYKFLAYSDKRRWNGNVYYSVGGGPTPPPTPLPTPNPTTSSPTSHPTTLSPTKSPTISPTKSPTKSPTLSPTRTPTRSPQSANDSLSPTKLPVGTPTTNSGGNGNDDGGIAPSQPSSSPSKTPTTETPTTSSSTLLPTSSPTIDSTESSLGPTQVLERFLPTQPSSSVKKGVFIGQFCIVSALLIGFANYFSF